MIAVRIVPRLLTRRPPRVLVLTGAALLAVAALWFSRLDVASAYTGGLVGPLIVVGMGSGLIFMPLTRTILATVQQRNTPGCSPRPSGAGAAPPSALATGLAAAAAFAGAVAVLARVADRVPGDP